ncbi:hypothetical protein FKM82_025479 [Ascaphus truei]
MNSGSIRYSLDLFNLHSDLTMYSNSHLFAMSDPFVSLHNFCISAKAYNLLGCLYSQLPFCNVLSLPIMFCCMALLVLALCF